MDVYLEYASRGKNAWWRYLLAPVVACFLAGLILLIFGVVLMLTHALPPDFAAQMQQPKFVAPFYLGIVFSFGALLIGLMVAAALFQGKRPADLIGCWRWDYFVMGLGIWLAAQAVLALVDILVVPAGFAYSANRGTATLGVFALVGILVQTFAEEFVFRGYVTQGMLVALKKPLPAAIASGLLFGLVHIANGLPQALNATVFGFICSLIAIRTGGIALTSGLHLANNYFGAVIVVSGNDVFRGSPGVISQNAPQLVWWDLCLGVAAMAGMLWLILNRPYFSASPAA